MKTRMYKNSLFGETDRSTVNGKTMVTGFVLDNHTGKPTGEAITVPANEVTLTGNDQTCLDISTMNEAKLLDFIMENPDYLCDHYYQIFGAAISDRYTQLRPKS